MISVYTITSDSGDEFKIIIPDNLIYIFNNLDDLREVVYQAIENGNHCCQNCGYWDCNLKNVYEYTCKSSPGAHDFVYLRFNNTIHGYGSECTIKLPDKADWTKKKYKEFAKLWLKDWSNFKQRLKNIIGTKQVTLG